MGFATAIYALAPGSADKTKGLFAAEKSKTLATSFLKSDDFAISFREQIDRSLGFGKVATCKLGEVLKEKYLVAKAGSVKKQ
jgi:hypothetical protein